MRGPTLRVEHEDFCTESETLYRPKTQNQNLHRGQTETTRNRDPNPRLEGGESAHPKSTGLAQNLIGVFSQNCRVNLQTAGQPCGFCPMVFCGGRPGAGRGGLPRAARAARAAGQPRALGSLRHRPVYSINGSPYTIYRAASEYTIYRPAPGGEGHCTALCIPLVVLHTQYLLTALRYVFVLVD